MSSADLLERMDVGKITADRLTGTSSDEAVAARSAVELGYTAYQQQIKTEERTFLADLGLLGIVPFTPESVAAYKAKMVKQVCGWRRYSVPNGLRADLALFIVSSIATFACAYRLLFAGATTLWWALPTAILLCAAIFFGVRVQVWTESANLVMRADARWMERDYRGYKGTVPKAVQEIALSVKGVRADATFYVDELHKTSVGVIDPFLGAKVGDTKFYLAVWDEPSFEGKPLA